MRRARSACGPRAGRRRSRLRERRDRFGSSRRSGRGAGYLIDDAGPGSGLVRRGARLACHCKTHQVRQRPPARQAAAEVSATDGIGKPTDDAPFNGCSRGCRAPGRDVLVQHRRIEVAEGRDRLSGADHIRESASRVCAYVSRYRGQVVEDRLAETRLRYRQVERSTRARGRRRLNRRAVIERCQILSRDGDDAMR